MLLSVTVTLISKYGYILFKRTGSTKVCQLLSIQIWNKSQSKKRLGTRVMEFFNTDQGSSEIISAVLK